jgi:hypothetical protein
MEITNDQVKQVIIATLRAGATADFKLRTAVRQYVNVQRRASMGETEVSNLFNAAIRDLKYNRQIALVIGRETKYALVTPK